MADSKKIWAATLAADGGAFYRAPLGTAVPTDALAVLPSAYKDHGWMGDDGFKISVKRDTTKHKSFGGQKVKTTQDSYDATVTVTCYEQNLATLKTMFGDSNVSVDTSAGRAKVTLDWSEQELPRSVFVQRFVDGNRTGMNIIEEGQITQIEDIELVHDKLWKYTATIDVYKPGSGNPGIRTLLDDPSTAYS